MASLFIVFIVLMLNILVPILIRVFVYSFGFISISFFLSLNTGIDFYDDVDLALFGISEIRILDDGRNEVKFIGYDKRMMLDDRSLYYIAIQKNSSLRGLGGVREFDFSFNSFKMLEPSRAMYGTVLFVKHYGYFTLSKMLGLNMFSVVPVETYYEKDAND